MYSAWGWESLQTAEEPAPEPWLALVRTGALAEGTRLVVVAAPGPGRAEAHPLAGNRHPGAGRALLQPGGILSPPSLVEKSR